MKRTFVAVPAVVLASVLFLAGCSSSTPVDDVAPSPTTAPSPTVEETPAADPAAIGISLGLVEGVPGDPGAVVSTKQNDDGTTLVTFKGTKENVLTLQQGFEDADYTWTDISAGSGTNVSASNEEYSIIISAMDAETYTYTIFKN